MVTRPDRSRIAVEGTDRRDFLQGLLTNDVVGLTDGAGCYAAHLTPQGRMVADLEVLSISERILLDVPVGVKDDLIEQLDELVFTEDVTVVDWTDSWAGLSVSGAATATSVATALGQNDDNGRPLSTFADHECRLVSVGGASAVVARTDPFGAWGVDLWVERRGEPELRRALRASGCIEVDRAQAEVTRIENGRPAFPTDMNRDTIPLEAGIEDRAISSTKGCYVGQEVIVRVLHRGQGRVARRLSGLTTDLTEPSALEAGARLWHGDREAGQLTSVAFSPKVGRVIGLAYVKREWLEPGTTLEVDVGSERKLAVVTQLPFADAVE